MFKEIWFRGLDDKDKEALKNALTNSVLSDRLRSIIKDWERELVINKSDYDNPSWSHRQAHLNGMSEILTRLSSILTVDQS